MTDVSTDTPVINFTALFPRSLGTIQVAGQTAAKTAAMGAFQKSMML